MFGFGKKKGNDNSDIDNIMGVNVDQKEQKTSRKENKENAKKKYDIEQQKAAIGNELKNCYTLISQSTNYEEADRVMAIMQNLKSGATDRNARAVYALDGFILRYVKELEVYCHQNNAYGIMSAIDNIDTCVNQRSYVTHTYYEDPKYLQAKVQLMQFQVNRENLNSEINKKIDTFYKLRDSAAGLSEARKMQVQKQMLQLKQEKENLQKQCDALDTQISNVTTLVGQMEQNASTYVPSQIMDEFGNVLEQTQEQDANIAQMTKMADKLNNANKTVNTQGMTVSDADSTEGTSTVTDISSMEI